MVTRITLAKKVLILGASCTVTRINLNFVYFFVGGGQRRQWTYPTPWVYLGKFWVLIRGKDSFAAVSRATDKNDWMLWVLSSVWAGHLLFQGGHSLLQMELQPLVGLGQQLVHRVRETLVVFVVHPLPLPRLRAERVRRVRAKEKKEWVWGGRDGRVGGELITSILLDWERERQRFLSECARSNRGFRKLVCLCAV